MAENFRLFAELERIIADYIKREIIGPILREYFGSTRLRLRWQAKQKARGRRWKRLPYWRKHRWAK